MWYTAFFCKHNKSGVRDRAFVPSAFMLRGGVG